MYISVYINNHHSSETIEDFQRSFNNYECVIFESGSLNQNEILLSKYETVFKGFDINHINMSEYTPRQCSSLAKYFPETILIQTRPILDIPNKKVSYFENKEKLERDIRTTSKLGKFLKKIGFFYSDKQIETLVNLLVEEANVVGDFHNSDQPEDFARVYKTKALPGGYLYDHKCLNASCMRYPFERLKHHPAYVYGSGDFQIFYMEVDGAIAARTIAYKGEETFGPIYAASEKYGNALKDHIESTTEYKYDSEPEYNGAKLLKVTADRYSDEFLMPYLDCIQSLNDEGDHFVISNYGDYEASSTDGTISVRERYFCECCDREMDEDDVIFIDGDSYCNGCTNFCEYSCEYTTEEVVEVYISKRTSQYWAESEAEANAVWCEEDECYYEKDFYKELQEERESENDE